MSYGPNVLGLTRKRYVLVSSQSISGPSSRVGEEVVVIRVILRVFLVEGTWWYRESEPTVILVKRGVRGVKLQD